MDGSPAIYKCVCRKRQHRPSTVSLSVVGLPPFLAQPTRQICTFQLFDQFLLSYFPTFVFFFGRCPSLSSTASPASSISASLPLPAPLLSCSESNSSATSESESARKSSSTDSSSSSAEPRSGRPPSSSLDTSSLSSAAAISPPACGYSQNQSSLQLGINLLRLPFHS